MAKIFVLSAPSGAGKSTLIRMALRDFPSFFFSVSATTRPPRKGEKEGREYYFKSEAAFMRMAEKGELAECQQVHGHFYGTPKAPILENLEKGRSVLIDMDVFGKKKFDAVFPEAVGIFIDAPSLDDLRNRMARRGADAPAVIEERLKNAREEIAFARREGKYEYTIMNKDLEKAYAELKAVIENELKKGR